MDALEITEMFLEDVTNIINGLKGVLGVQLLSKKDKEDLLRIEALHKEDIIPVINAGLDECLNREFCLVMFKTADFRIPPKPTVILRTDTGRILGHEIISNEDRENYASKDNVIFLSNNFILFKPENISRSGIREKQQFYLPPIPFPELNDIHDIYDVVSGTPSTKGDEFIKNSYGYPQDPKVATILIGFSKKE